MTKALLVLASLLSVVGLTGCGKNNGAPVQPGSDSLDGSCWQLRQVVEDGWPRPGPVRLLWQHDPARPGCGMELCFEDASRWMASVACNSCSGSYVDEGDVLRIGGGACSEVACSCGPPWATAGGAWAVTLRDADSLHLEIPTLTPGGARATWQFHRR